MTFRHFSHSRIDSKLAAGRPHLPRERVAIRSALGVRGQDEPTLPDFAPPAQRSGPPRRGRGQPRRGRGQETHREERQTGDGDLRIEKCPGVPAGPHRRAVRSGQPALPDLRGIQRHPLPADLGVRAQANAEGEGDEPAAVSGGFRPHVPGLRLPEGVPGYRARPRGCPSGSWWSWGGRWGES